MEIIVNIKEIDGTQMAAKITGDFQINENDREREVRQYENPKSLLESHVDVLMNRGQAEINEITENPYLIIDTQNVVFHEDAPTKDALYNNDCDTFGELLHQNWELKKQLSISKTTIIYF